MVLTPRADTESNAYSLSVSAAVMGKQILTQSECGGDLSSDCLPQNRLEFISVNLSSDCFTQNRLV